MKLKLTACIALTVFIYIIFNMNIWKENRTLHWDKSSYYAFLPATFLYHDLERMDFIDAMNEQYSFVPGVPYYGMIEQSNGKRLDRYHIGVSFFQLPFFTIAHIITSLGQEYPADGYSPYYMLWICISSAFWSAMGLWVLGVFLKRYFNHTITITVLLLLAFGTNLYFYSSFDTGMSHPYSLFLIACVLNFTDKWYRSSQAKWVILLGLIFGLIFIVRPVNIICLLIPLLWQTEQERLSNRISFFSQQWKSIALASIIGLAVCFPQLAYWKYITGNWLIYAYKGEYFDFLDPHIMDGLFSYRKGWFLYTPLALIASIGFVCLRKKLAKTIPALLSTMSITIYVTFSWESWFYGGSFGCRALIDFLPIMAFPLAALLQYLFSKGKFVHTTTAVFLSLVVALNLWQTYQFSKGVIPWDHNTKEHYWRMFFKLEHAPGDEVFLEE